MSDFKLLMVYSEGKNNEKGWIVNAKNCEEKYFYNYVTCLTTGAITRMPKKLLTALFTPHKEHQETKTEWRYDDKRRKLDFDEYMALEFALKKQGFIYNKKTDKLITV